MIQALVAERTLELSTLALRARVLETSGAPGGLVVLMLHGNPDNADEWRPLMTRLGTTHRCIAPDFPSYGYSTDLPDSFDYSLEAQRHFVDAVLAELGVTQPVTLVVHDTGGMVGTDWAVRHLDRIAGVVFTNTVVFENFPWFPIARRWADMSWRGRIRAGLGMKAMALKRGALFRKIFAAQSPQLGKEDLDRFVATFALNPVAMRATLRQFRQFVPARFFTGFEVARMKLISERPARVLWGDSDPYLPSELSQRFGNAPVTVLPDVGHWVPLIAAERLAEEVRAVTPK